MILNNKVTYIYMSFCVWFFFLEYRELLVRGDLKCLLLLILMCWFIDFEYKKIAILWYTYNTISHALLRLSIMIRTVGKQLHFTKLCACVNNPTTFFGTMLYCLGLLDKKFDVKQYTYDFKPQKRHVYSDLNDIRLEYLETIWVSRTKSFDCVLVANIPDLEIKRRDKSLLTLDLIMDNLMISNFN